MGVGQSGNTLWRKYIISRGLKEVKWRIYTEKKKEAGTSEGGTREARPRGSHKLISVGDRRGGEAVRKVQGGDQGPNQGEP